MSSTPSTLGTVALGLVGVGLIGAAAASTQGSANALTQRQRAAKLKELIPDKALHWLSYSSGRYSSNRYATSFPSPTLAHLWEREMDKDSHYKNVSSLSRVTNRHSVHGNGRPPDHHWLRPDGNLSRDYTFARGLGGRRRLMFNDIQIPIELFPDTVRTRIETVLIAERAMKDTGTYMTSDIARVAAMRALAQRALAAESDSEARDLFDELGWFSTSYKPNWPRRDG